VIATATRHPLHCPVAGCGCKLGEVAGRGHASIWRVCPGCKATIRFDLPTRRWTIEEGPRRRVS
jgi:hypothetical protein